MAPPPSEQAPSPPDRIHALLVRIFADREAGLDRSREDYERLFPGEEEMVARELARLAPEESRAQEASQAGRIGRFVLRERLGRGAQAIVFRAVDEETHEEVALKISLVDTAADPRLRMRIEREVQALLRLRHPDIGEVIEAGEHRGLPYVATRYVGARSLECLLDDQRQSGAADWPGGARWPGTIERIARAVHRAHEIGILHRDIKPSNIIVAPDGSPALIDFGLALDEETNSTRLTSPGERIGTRAYLPPEAFLERALWDRRSDVYMLGATLFECLVLRAPFETTREAVKPGRNQHEAPDIRRSVPQLPRDLALIVATALSMNPKQRYQTAMDLAEDLRRFADGQPILARRPSLAIRFGRWFRRDPILAGILISLIASLGGGTVFSCAMFFSARKALKETRRITDERNVSYLLAQAEEGLWPVLPEQIPAMDRWLEEADGILARHQLLVEVRTVPADAESAKQLSRLSEVARNVRAWRSEAAALEASTIEGARADWDRTVGEIARDPIYEGLQLEPQLGLVPLGRDPGSQLFEFAHPQTGSIPARDARSGELMTSEDTCLVFVLLPGGSFQMGADVPSAERPAGSANVDPEALDWNEGPSHTVRVEPFFLSKYEMTQAEWMRVDGENPSRWSPGSDAKGAITLRHPVESVSWEESRRAMKRFGLALPTEAQWEYGARAGSSSPWSTGWDRDSLRGAANLADQAARRAGFLWPSIDEFPEFDDGWVEHAPVGSFRPNAFGFHDVHGNGWEFCQDLWSLYANHVVGRDQRSVKEELRTKRGGGFYESAHYARSAFREGVLPDEHTFSAGLRPARDLSGTWTRRGAIPPSQQERAR